MIAFPKPSQIRKVTPAVREFKDAKGNVIRDVCNLLTKAGRDEYELRKKVMWVRQGGMCSLCGQYLKKDEMTFEHSDGRGLSGGHRDDRIMKDGVPYNTVAHASCNALKGSVRLEQFLNEKIRQG